MTVTYGDFLDVVLFRQENHGTSYKDFSRYLRNDGIKMNMLCNLSFGMDMRTILNGFVSAVSKDRFSKFYPFGTDKIGLSLNYRFQNDMDFFLRYIHLILKDVDDFLFKKAYPFYDRDWDRYEYDRYHEDILKELKIEV